MEAIKFRNALYLPRDVQNAIYSIGHETAQVYLYIDKRDAQFVVTSEKTANINLLFIDMVAADVAIVQDTIWEFIRGRLVTKTQLLDRYGRSITETFRPTVLNSYIHKEYDVICTCYDPREMEIITRTKRFQQAWELHLQRSEESFVKRDGSYDVNKLAGELWKEVAPQVRLNCHGRTSVTTEAVNEWLSLRWWELEHMDYDESPDEYMLTGEAPTTACRRIIVEHIRRSRSNYYALMYMYCTPDRVGEAINVRLYNTITDAAERWFEKNFTDHDWKVFEDICVLCKMV